LSKAAQKLGLSQPALSAHVKRAESLLRGEIFSKSANGTVLTELGQLVLAQARRMLDANDQILRIGGATEGPQPIRVGIATPFVKDFFANRKSDSLKGIVVNADASVNIAKALSDGHLDIGYFYEDTDVAPLLSNVQLVKEADEEFVWVRSRDFVIRPGAPIPILHSPKFDFLTRVMTANEISYRVVFSTPDYEARVAAAHSGVGLMALPLRMLPSSLVQAKEYYLPELPPVKRLLCSRANLDSPGASRILEELAGTFFDAVEEAQRSQKAG